MTPIYREIRHHLEQAAGARRRGDIAAADPGGTAALVILRSMLPAIAGEAVRV